MKIPNPKDTTWVLQMDRRQCRDWLTNRYYKQDKCDNDCGSAWYRRADSEYVCNATHQPIPDTLDGAAACLPDGWSLSLTKKLMSSACVTLDPRIGQYAWCWRAIAPRTETQTVEVFDSGDEILDRLRLSVLALDAELGAKP